MLLQALYALLISMSVIGIGFSFWCYLRRVSVKFPLSLPAAPADIYFSVAVSWMLGYFFCEGILNILTVIRVFKPFVVNIFGVLILLAGGFAIYHCRKELRHEAQETRSPLWERGILLAIVLFVMFWNLYPAFDVDSMSFYFTAVKQFLERGGRVFVPEADIRLSVVLGENYLYAIGFALNMDLTVFQQIVHGIGKVMLVVGVYGAARLAGAKRLALIAAALVMSEEHLIASGVNFNVRINMLLTVSVFLAFFALFFYVRSKKPEYFLLSLLAAFSALTCKYICVAHFLAVTGGMTVMLLTDKQTREAVLFLKGSKGALAICLTAAFFTAITYVHNWIVTGTPVFPASIGPISSKYYDPIVGELARDWLYHFGIGDAVKYLSIFSVWPGVLASKLLLPLTILAGIVLMLIRKDENKLAASGLAFVLMSAVLIIIVEVYMVFEMRYYRYGIGIYALACVFLLTFLFDTFFENLPWLKKLTTPTGAALIVLISLYCAKYSFDVMGEMRVSAREVVGFLAGKTSNKDVLEKYYKKYSEAYDDLMKLDISPDELGFIATLNWPHAVFPIKGANLDFVKSSGLPALAYYDEGLFAEELRKRNIKYVFNKLVNYPGYPIGDGAPYAVFTRCGRLLPEGTRQIIELDKACLDTLIAEKDPENARRRLNEAVAKAKSYPDYKPFNEPPYGGASGVLQ